MKMFRRLIVGLLFATFAFAADDTGPHGGKIVQNSTHKFEVKIDQNGNIVEVYTLKAKKEPPKNMGITLFRDSGGNQLVELRAVDVSDPLPKYQGALTPSAGSYVGAELRFNVDVKSMEVLKFVPYIPTKAEGLRSE